MLEILLIILGITNAPFNLVVPFHALIISVKDDGRNRTGTVGCTFSDRTFNTCHVPLFCYSLEDGRLNCNYHNQHKW